MGRLLLSANGAARALKIRLEGNHEDIFKYDFKYDNYGSGLDGSPVHDLRLWA